MSIFEPKSFLFFEQLLFSFSASMPIRDTACYWEKVFNKRSWRQRANQSESSSWKPTLVLPKFSYRKFDGEEKLVLLNLGQNLHDQIRQTFLLSHNYDSSFCPFDKLNWMLVVIFLTFENWKLGLELKFDQLVDFFDCGNMRLLLDLKSWYSIFVLIYPRYRGPYIRVHWYDNAAQKTCSNSSHRKLNFLPKQCQKSAEIQNDSNVEAPLNDWN